MRISVRTTIGSIVVVSVLIGAWQLFARWKNIDLMTRAKNDCGPQALSGLLKEYGIRTTPESIAAIARTNAEGTTMLGLRDAAVALGVKAEGMRLSYAGLESRLSSGEGAIAFVNRDHYVWIKKTHPLGLVVKDVSPGFRFFKKEEWSRIWFEDPEEGVSDGEGLCLVITPPPGFQRPVPVRAPLVKVPGSA